MNSKRPANDNQSPATSRGARRRRANFYWKMDYYPRQLPAPVLPEAANTQEHRPLRVLTIRLEGEI
jgi:hypothetical protein